MHKPGQVNTPEGAIPGRTCGLPARRGAREPDRCVFQVAPGWGQESSKGVSDQGLPVQTADAKEWAPEGAPGIAALDLEERRQEVTAE